MKKLTLLALAIIFLFFISCTTDVFGESHVSTFGWILIIGIPLFVIIVGRSGSKDLEHTAQVLEKRGIKQSDIIKAGTYVGGHPSIDNNVNFTVVYKRGEFLKIASQQTDLNIPLERGSIPIPKIKDITVENASTIENKVTLGRVLLVGVFALAWRKKKKNEMAFVAIDWNDGKFDHSTLFNFEGKEAMQNANTFRNKLIRIVS